MSEILLVTDGKSEDLLMQAFQLLEKKLGMTLPTFRCLTYADMQVMTANHPQFRVALVQVSCLEQGWRDVVRHLRNASPDAFIVCFYQGGPAAKLEGCVENAGANFCAYVSESSPEHEPVRTAELLHRHIVSSGELVGT